MLGINPGRHWGKFRQHGKLYRPFQSESTRKLRMSSRWLTIGWMSTYGRSSLWKKNLWNETKRVGLVNSLSQWNELTGQIDVNTTFRWRQLSKGSKRLYQSASTNVRPKFKYSSNCMFSFHISPSFRATSSRFSPWILNPIYDPTYPPLDDSSNNLP